MQKSLRKITAKETLEITRQGYYLNESGRRVDISKAQNMAIEETQYFASSKLDVMLSNLILNPQFDTIFEVVEETSIRSILRNTEEGHLNPLCLNFASAKNPGGGFFNGAQAQEESLARSSSLYPCQISSMEFYETHRAMKSCMYTDGMIYSPKVPILRKDNGNLLEEVILSSIITAAAVNAGVVKRFEAHRFNEIEEIMKKRIDKLLGLSTLQEHQTLILGAWGCGVFQNDPEIIAGIFQNLLMNKYKGVFKKVVFAVYAKNKKFINAFQNRF